MDLHLIDGQPEHDPRREAVREVGGRPAVTVVVPTRNTADTIDYLLGRIIFATSREPFDIEVLVVDHGSTDGTREAVREWSSCRSGLGSEPDRRRPSDRPERNRRPGGSSKPGSGAG